MHVYSLLKFKNTICFSGEKLKNMAPTASPWERRFPPPTHDGTRADCSEVWFPVGSLTTAAIRKVSTLLNATQHDARF